MINLTALFIKPPDTGITVISEWSWHILRYIPLHRLLRVHDGIASIPEVRMGATLVLPVVVN
jgi:hypothetical protein